MGKHDGLIILVVVGIPLALVAADFTVLEGKLGIRRFINNLKFPKKFESPIGPNGEIVMTRAPMGMSETTPGAIQGRGNPGRTSSTGYGPGYPSSSYARISLS